MAAENILANPDLLRPLTKTKRAEVDLSSLTRAELEGRVGSLEKHIQQLRNVIAKHHKSALPVVKAKLQNFNFDRFKRRHVLLRVAYFGWDYVGFATQEDAGKTIESELFAALLQTRLVPSREQANYHRCGRTDKGVSATGQVISLDVRTNLLEGEGVWQTEDYSGPLEAVAGKEKEELDFCNLLNRNLPPEIRVTGWSPAPRTDFSARFDCEGRSYRYVFPRGLVNIDRMEKAGQLLIGLHDFRNFCKMDVGNGVVKYERRVDRVSVTCVQQEDGEAESPYDLCQLEIASKAFLWHQIRCIMAVLLMIGEGLEDEEVIPQMLDVGKMPCRPTYSMAGDLPLNLHHSTYSGVEWILSPVSREHVIRSTQALWAEHAIKAGMVRGQLGVLEGMEGESVISQLDGLTGRRREKVYTPLLQLPKCPSLEDKIRTVVKRRKLNVEVTNDENVAGDEISDSVIASQMINN